MDVINSENIFKLLRVHHTADGQLKRQPSGRFIVHDGNIHILEDYFGDLSHLKDGPVDEKTNRWLTSMKRNPYYDIVTDEDVRKGNRPDLIPEKDLGDPAEDSQAQFEGQPAGDSNPSKPRKPSKFEYLRDGQVHNIEFRNGSAFLDGQQLDPVEIKRILEHHASGVGVLRYPVRTEGEG
jgi:hypothetical protein